MARPREFQIEEALGGAMDVFWSKGYDGAALPDLLEGMGITRGSLYKAFGDKKSLFLRVLDLYEAEAILPAEMMLCDPSVTGRARVRALFDTVVAAAAAGDRRGCLLCAAAAGPAARDADIGAIVQALLTRMERAFAVAMGNADIASMLVSHYVGLRTMVRSGRSLTELEAGIAALERCLPSGAPGA